MDEKDTSRRENGVGGEVTLSRLLQTADLQRYESKMRHDLKLRHAGDIQYVEEMDLSGIGMSRPEQKRLRKEYERLYKSGFVGKLKRVFGRGESADRRETQTTREDHEQQQDEQHVIPIERISLCKELGKGEFGAVWQASWRGGPSGTAEDMQVAVKCVSPDKLVASSSSFLQEAAIMTRMRHDNVVRLYGVVLDTKRVMMVSELATCGSLLECLLKAALRDSFPVHVLCDYAEQMATGMAYLESQRLIHRDLAARNVLVFSPKKVKISDFGLSRSLGVGEDYYRSEFNPAMKLPIAWCAPECINYLKFTSSSDVWAYGVTLWEMFTYGEMPWNGMTGAEILESVDRKRHLLARPPFCPDDIYETMKECWTHSPVQRPTFAQLVTLLPERLPQTVRAVCDLRDGIADHLQFKKDDLITVIDKTPSSYPDGFYWFGSLRNGKAGLFKPADTVAHLGAEIPSSAKVLTGCVGGATAVEKKDEKEKRNSKKSREEEREKRKALISEPVGEVRHTCHVGIDGTAFGLLQLDKKELVPPSVSPSTRRSTPTGAASPAPSHAPSLALSSTTGCTSPVLLRPEPARDCVPLRETMSMRDVGSLRDPTSPPSNRAPSQPPHKSSRSSVQPSAPPLTNSAASSMNRDMQEAFEQLNASLRSMESSPPATTTTTASRISPPSPSSSSFTPSCHPTAPLFIDDEFLSLNRRPVNGKAPVSAVYARPPRDMLPSPSASTTDSILEAEVMHLERDLTDFSISTLNDFSDTRALLGESSSSNGSILLPKVTSSDVRPMTDEELARWHLKQEREHRKAELQLSEARRKEEAARPSPAVTSGSDDSGSANYYLLKSNQPSTPQWTNEAQEAYKLLVECGTALKETPSPVVSPVPSMKSTLDRKEKRVTIIENPRSNGNKMSPVPPPRPATPPREETESVTSYSPQKRVHIIETKLLNGPAEGLSPSERPQPPGLPPKGEQRQPPGLPPKMRQVPVMIDGRSLNYDNLNGVGAGAARNPPPPVPPKPKLNLRPPSTSPPPPSSKNPSDRGDSPGCAPAIARSQLFSSQNKTEEVVKF